MFLLLLMVVVAQGSIWSSLAGVDNEKMKLMEKVVGGRKRFTHALRGTWAWHCWVMIPNRFSESWFHKARVYLQEIRLH